MSRTLSFVLGFATCALVGSIGLLVWVLLPHNHPPQCVEYQLRTMNLNFGNCGGGGERIVYRLATSTPQNLICYDTDDQGNGTCYQVPLKVEITYPL